MTFFLAIISIISFSIISIIFIILFNLFIILFALHPLSLIFSDLISPHLIQSLVCCPLLLAGLHIHGRVVLRELLAQHENARGHYLIVGLIVELSDPLVDKHVPL